MVVRTRVFGWIHWKMLRVPHLARLTDFVSTCMFRSCVSSGGSTNTGWHIDVHHVKTFAHPRCEVGHNWDMEMGHLWLNGWGIYDLRVWLWLKLVGQLWQSKLLFRLEVCSKNAGLDKNAQFTQDVYFSLLKGNNTIKGIAKTMHNQIPYSGKFLNCADCIISEHPTFMQHAYAR